jgi:hypothetical protein
MSKPVIRVYFETPNGSYADEVATFTEEEHYDACLSCVRKTSRGHRVYINRIFSRS